MSEEIFIVVFFFQQKKKYIEIFIVVFYIFRMFFLQILYEFLQNV